MSVTETIKHIRAVQVQEVVEEEQVAIFNSSLNCPTTPNRFEKFSPKRWRKQAYRHRPFSLLMY